MGTGTFQCFRTPNPNPTIKFNSGSEPYLMGHRVLYAGTLTHANECTTPFGSILATSGRVRLEDET